MSGSVFRAMLLSFLRDRGALVMAFALPIAFFLVFAAIFAGAAGQQARPILALCDEVDSGTSRRLVTALRAEAGLAPLVQLKSAADVREWVRAGEADAGLVVRRDADALGSVGGLGAAPLLLVEDPAKSAAAQLVAGVVQRSYFAKLPDVALGGLAGFLDDQYLELQEEQRQRLAAGLEELRVEAEAGQASSSTTELFERASVVGPDKAKNHVAYSAGAVAILFLFLSAVQGALTLLEERDSGVVDRLLAGVHGLQPVILGKFLFLSFQGCLQVTAIFLVAWQAHGVSLPAHAGAFALVTFAAAAAAAGFALAITSVCTSRQQAQTLGNVGALILSALGGCMVPRFFMPPAVRQLGWLTPNTWALEAYTSVFWREEGLGAQALPVALLFAFGLAGLALTRRATRSWERI